MFKKIIKIPALAALITASILPLDIHATKAAAAPAISVTFAGDTMMDWSIKNTLKKYGADYPFRKVKAEVTKSDLAVANLETAVTTRTAKFTKTYNFKSDPASLTGVKNAGFDLVSLANNHAMDYNRQGLLDTMTNLRKNKLLYMGAGVNSAEAYSAKRYIIKGKRLSFLAFSRVLPSTSWIAQSHQAGIANGYDLNLILSTIKKEKPHADYLFVYLHWGVEKAKTPEAFERDWARKMIDAGADAVIGSHPHVVQGFEYYKGKPIAYSLGNFLFPDYVTGDKAQTGLLHLDIQGSQIQMSFNPYFIYKDQIRAQTAAQKKKVWASLQSVSYGVKIVNGKIIKK